MNRRRFLQMSGATGLLASQTLSDATAAAVTRDTTATSTAPINQTPTAAARGFAFDEQTIGDLQQAMTDGGLTAEAITRHYLERIAAVDKAGPSINSVIETNPDAIAIAVALDRERKATGPRGPLHGIPILLKDNIDTADRMKTSAGSLALADSIASRDAFLAERLRMAGAVLLGKTNLSEWANFRSDNSSSGWSARGGQTRNPYALDRNPCGSSSGSGVAVSANLCTAAVGTETDGSIVCPASINGIVGIKPTVGLVSRTGVIPISATQDTAGPMARTVADAAALLSALVGLDGRDPATEASNTQLRALTKERAAFGRSGMPDYRAFLIAGGLKGARIGVARKAYRVRDEVKEAFEEALRALRGAGAVIVDPADIPNADKYGAAEMELLLHEFKAGLNAYLETTARTVPARTLAALIAFNEQQRDRELALFGQETFIKAEKKGALTSAAYLKAKRSCELLSRTQGIDVTFAKHRLDAIVMPTNGPAWMTDHVNGDRFTGGNSSVAAVSGYPSITVPMGFWRGLPLGLSFVGRAWSEPRLITLAYAFEQATKARRAPTFPKSVDVEHGGSE
jgi:amidase